MAERKNLSFGIGKIPVGTVAEAYNYSGFDYAIEDFEARSRSIQSAFVTSEAVTKVLPVITSSQIRVSLQF